MHIQELTPDEGERAATIGGTRSGKSSFQDWSLRHVQSARPDAMQILVDSKPRFRAETERGPLGRGRRNAAHRYTSWTKGPIVPNSVVVDIWDDNPFHGLFKRPGEIAILQSGETRDWKRMLELLQAFTKANVSGRERRVIVDECLDFTSATLGVSTRRTMFSIGSREPEVNEILGLIWEHIKYQVFRPLCSKCYPESHSFICALTRT